MRRYVIHARCPRLLAATLVLTRRADPTLDGWHIRPGRLRTLLARRGWIAVAPLPITQHRTMTRRWPAPWAPPTDDRIDR